MTEQLVGRGHRFDLGPLKVAFTFDSPSQGGFVVEEGGGSHRTGTPRPSRWTSRGSARAST
ncbi:hypothetical protein DSY14_03445 [Nocardiopsis sp. MG754419]|nr:hypothetical protein [Nocardiopsis sp. MG754419]